MRRFDAPLPSKAPTKTFVSMTMALGTTQYCTCAIFFQARTRFPRHLWHEE